MESVCPRCGFIQPKDRYCANCGVDMENYRPEKPSFAVRLLKSTAFQLGFAFIVIGLMVFIITKNQSTSGSLAQQLDQKPVLVVSPDVNEDDDGDTSISSTNTDDDNLQSQVAAAKMSAEVDAGNAAAIPDQPATETAIQLPSTLNIYFLEIPLIELEKLFALGQIVHEGNSHRAIVVDVAKDKALLSLLVGSELLPPGAQKPKITYAETILLNFAPRNRNASRSNLMFDILPRPNPDKSISLELEGALTVQSGDGAAPMQVFLDRFVTSLKNRQALIIAGLVPHQKIAPSELRLLTQTPLSILGSPEFIDNQTEFLIAIQPQ